MSSLFTFTVYTVAASALFLNLLFVSAHYTEPDLIDRQSKEQLVSLIKELDLMKLKLEQLETKLEDRDVGVRDHFLHRAKRTPNAIRPSAPAKTCLEALTNDPNLKSGMYWIDPDGLGIGDAAIYVYCNMTSGSTSVLHDSEKPLEVTHCPRPGCYSKKINYEATLRQVVALSELSHECHQSIQFECYDVAFEFNGLQYAWWTDRHGKAHYFWAGNDTGSGSHHTCGCGLDGTCIDENLKCNCDSDLPMKLSDIGVITERTLLPVTSLNFGRTQAPVSIGKHMLGRLECSGKVVLNGMPKSCKDLWRLGYSLAGLYLVKGDSGLVETVYCDMNRLPGDPKIQQFVGFADVKSNRFEEMSAVYFYVQKNAPFAFMVNENTTAFMNASGKIPFELELVNVGDAMDGLSGYFTAPVQGTYYFSFTSITNQDGVEIALVLNDNHSIGRAKCGTSNNIRRSSYRNNNNGTNDFNPCSIQSMIPLGEGDRVGLVLTIPGSSIYDDDKHYTHFSGWLMSPNTAQSDIWSGYIDELQTGPFKHQHQMEN